MRVLHAGGSQHALDFLIVLVLFIQVITRADFQILDSTMFTNPNVETGCFDITLPNSFTPDSPTLPKYFFLSPSTNPKTAYLRAHVITSTKLSLIDLSKPNSLPGLWYNEILYIRVGTDLQYPFPSNTIVSKFTITFCVLEADCQPANISKIDQFASDGIFREQPWMPRDSPGRSIRKFYRVNDNHHAFLQHIDDDPVIYQINVDINHKLDYSIVSQQRLTHWVLPPPPPPTTDLSSPHHAVQLDSNHTAPLQTQAALQASYDRSTMFEILLRDAFMDTYTIHRDDPVDFFDIKTLGVYYFNILTPISDLGHSAVCYFNQIPVRIEAKSQKTRQFRVFIPNSASTDPQDIFSKVRQIRPKTSYRAQFTCSQQIRLSNDWATYQASQDIPLYFLIHLGYREPQQSSQQLSSQQHTLPQQAPTYKLYPDQFTSFFDPSKLHPYEIPPPRCRNLMTEWNPLQSVLTTYFLLEYSNTTGALSGPSFWDTRQYLFYHTNAKLQVFFDDLAFDLEHFTPTGNSQIESESGYAALYVLPDVGFEDLDKDWGPLMTVTKVYQNGLTGFPLAEFEFFSETPGPVNGSAPGMEVRRQDFDVFNIGQSRNPEHSNFLREVDPPQCHYPSPYFRDVPLSPYHSFNNYTVQTLPWGTVPVHMVIKWHLPATRFLTAFPQWSAHIHFEHTDPITLKQSNTLFEAVTYFNATTYNITNAVHVPQTHGSPPHLHESTPTQRDQSRQSLAVAPFPEQEGISDLLKLRANCGLIGGPGLEVLLTTQSDNFIMLNKRGQLPFDVLSTSSMHGREFYYVVGAQYQRYGPSAQSVETTCQIAYQKKSGKSAYSTIFHYNYTASVVTTLNSIQFQNFEYPAASSDAMGELLVSFTRLKINCLDVYHVDFWSNYLSIDQNPAPYPQTPKNIHFPSCFRYTIYEPIDDDSDEDSSEIGNTYEPINCGTLFTDVHQTGKRVRVHAYMHNPTSQLYPKLSLVGVWVSERDTWALPTWAWVLIFTALAAILAVFGYCLWKRYEVQRDQRRHRITVTQGNDVELEEELYNQRLCDSDSFN